MRHLHTLRLSRTDAATLDFMYSAVQVLGGHCYAPAALELQRHVGAICAARLLDKIPLGWQWSFAGNSLYIAVP